jgi:hypothetical protein
MALDPRRLSSMVSQQTKIQEWKSMKKKVCVHITGAVVT